VLHFNSMNQEQELKHLDRDIVRLDKDSVKTEKSLVVLTRWIIVLTAVMVAIGFIQLLVMWPKRTYCIDASDKVQVCEPDYYPFDTDPTDAAYKLDKKFGFN
jgi:hypothetical protein